MSGLPAALVLAALVACRDDRSTRRDAAARPAAGTLRGTFALTYYWIPVEQDLPGPAVARVYDRSCAVLAKASASFASELALAGAGKLADGRMLTVDGECRCPRSPCFRVLAVDQSWGIGAANRALVPFRSLAVDRSVVPIGTPLWIGELDGVALPDDVPLPEPFARRHDGCVVADDVGGSVTGYQIDWFVARRRYYRALDDRLHLTRVAVFDGGERCTP